MSNLHEIRTVKCAHCGKVRQEANHWFVAAIDSGRFRCRPLGLLTGTDQSVYGRGERLRRSDEPVCGQECAQKLFERYLAGHATSRKG